MHVMSGPIKVHELHIHPTQPNKAFCEVALLLTNNHSLTWKPPSLILEDSPLSFAFIRSVLGSRVADTVMKRFAY